MRKHNTWVSFYGANLFVLILYGLMILLLVCSVAFGSSMAAQGAENLTDIGGTPLIFLMTIGEALVIGVPVAVFIAVGRPGKSTLKLARPRISEMLLTFGMAAGGYGVFMFLQILTQMALSSLGLPQQGLNISISTGWELAVWVAVLGILPAVAEEFAFRGVVLGIYERHLRPFWAILLSGILFGALHMQVAFFYFYIGLGIILGWVVYRSRSLWTGILYHFTHNTLAVVLSYLAQTYADSADQAASSVLGSTALGPWGIIAAVSLVIFLGCFFPFARLTRGRAPLSEKPARIPLVDWSPALVIGIGLVLLVGLSLLGTVLIQYIGQNLPIQ